MSDWSSDVSSSDLAHSAYVALSRHRSGTSLHYGRDDFADEPSLRRTLGRARPKDMALDSGDYAAKGGRAERDPARHAEPATGADAGKAGASAEERRAGKEGVRTSSSRATTY